jgi:uncharacterized oxidoreductase
MSRLYPHQRVADWSRELFRAFGAPAKVADIASSSLIESSLMGHDSHGVLRVPEYLDFIREGKIKPAAEICVEQTGPSTAIVDCAHGFGAVGGARSVEVAIEIAHRQMSAVVLTRNCNHLGRVGAYVQTAAEEGMIAFAFCNSPVYGHFVVPYGGRAGRLATNPIAYALPTSGESIVADFSTSVAPEGKVRFYRNEQRSVPAGWILDSHGRPSTNPTDFYGPPRGGLLPFGGDAAHKGYALGLLVEVLAGVLAGVSTTDANAFGNGFCLILINPAAFGSLAAFRERMDETVAYMKSSPPAEGFDEVLVPGELEFRTRRARMQSGIPVDEPTLSALRRYADDVGLQLTFD